jgi:hypothetical protein
LAKLEVVGKILLADALHTQVQTVQQTLYKQGGDYLLTVTKNQPGLFDTLSTLFNEQRFSPSGDGAHPRPDGEHVSDFPCSIEAPVENGSTSMTVVANSGSTFDFQNFSESAEARETENGEQVQLATGTQERLLGLDRAGTSQATDPQQPTLENVGRTVSQGRFANLERRILGQTGGCWHAASR